MNIKKVFLLSICSICLNHHALAEADARPALPSFRQTDDVKNLILDARADFQKPYEADEHDGYEVRDKKGNVFYVDNIKNPTIRVGNYIANYSDKTINPNQINIRSHVGKICFTMLCK